MNRQSYMTRALQSRDPRFALVLGKLGYDTRDVTDAPEQKAPPPKVTAPQEDIATLRERYHQVVGKKPFMRVVHEGVAEISRSITGSRQ